GTSNTILVGERHVKPGPTAEALARGPFWANSFNLYTGGAVYLPWQNIPNVKLTLSPDYATCANSATATPPGTGNSNYCKYGWGSFHSGGNLNWLFGDGSVRSTTTGISFDVLGALMTISGGEVVDMSNFM